MSGHDWRIEIGAEDYFGHRQKEGILNSRRPVIRNPSDLVGPGIDAQAIRITNFNDELATFDGFFSADYGAANAPNDQHSFIGFVSVDSQMGGVQSFYSIDSGVLYSRVFRRNPSDLASIFWYPWKGDVDSWPLIYARGGGSILVPGLWLRPGISMVPGSIRGSISMIGGNANNGGVRINETGFYAVTGYARLRDGTATSRRVVMIEKTLASTIDQNFGNAGDDNIIAREEYTPSDDGNSYVSASLAGEMFCEAGEAIRMVVFQNSAGNISCEALRLTVRRT